MELLSGGPELWDLQECWQDPGGQCRCGQVPSLPPPRAEAPGISVKPRNLHRGGSACRGGRMEPRSSLVFPPHEAQKQTAAIWAALTRRPGRGSHTSHTSSASPPRQLPSFGRHLRAFSCLFDLPSPSCSHKMTSLPRSAGKCPVLSDPQTRQYCRAPGAMPPGRWLMSQPPELGCFGLSHRDAEEALRL